MSIVRPQFAWQEGQSLLHQFGLRGWQSPISIYVSCFINKGSSINQWSLLTTSIITHWLSVTYNWQRVSPTTPINQWSHLLLAIICLSGPCNRPHTTASKRKSCVLVNVWMQGWEFRKRSFAISFRLLASLRRDVPGAPYEGTHLPSKPMNFSTMEITDNDFICMHGWIIDMALNKRPIHAYK